MSKAALTARYAACAAEHAGRKQRFLQLRLRAARAAIIDLDGTMADTAPDFHIAANQVRAEYGLAPWPMQRVADCIGKGPENLVRQLLGADFSPAQLAQHVEAALASYHRHYEAVNGRHARLYPGVRDGLAALAAGGLKLACVTNKPHAQALRLLECLALDTAFELVYGGDSFPLKKPDPLPVRRACAALGIGCDEAVLIGDSSNDAQAGQAAGCAVLLVPYGYNHGQPIEHAQPDAIVPDLHAAARMILA